MPGAEFNRVAVIVPLTGPDGPVGTSISNAAKLALLDTGEKTLRITIYDSTAPAAPRRPPNARLPRATG